MTMIIEMDNDRSNKAEYEKIRLYIEINKIMLEQPMLTLMSMRLAEVK